MRITLSRVTVEYEGERVLEDINLDIQGPGLVQLLGPNGAGKTTLLRTILGLVRPRTGRILVDGQDVTGDSGKAGRLIAYVPQRPPLSPWNPMTAWDLVYSRILFEKPWPRIRGAWAAERAEWALEEAGLERDAWDRRLHELSGGQLMRVFIARALALDKKILLLDEPLAPVDPKGRRELARTLARLASERLVVVTSHDPELLLEHTSMIVLLNRRVIAYGPPSEVLRDHILSRVYGGSVMVRGGHVHIADHH